MSNLSKCVSLFVKSLENQGVEQVVVSPGSRNFPLIRAFNTNKSITCHSVVDERSAAFVAVGMVQQSRKPVVVCCTSGTAALNFYPAVAEAYYARIPILVLTADRPNEAIDNWEGQSIRQTEIFERHIVASFETPNQYNQAQSFVDIAVGAFQAAQNNRGPVHVNLPFREPFYSSSGEEESESRAVKDGSVNKRFDKLPNALAREIQTAQKILWLNGASLPNTKLDFNSPAVVFSDVISNQMETIPHWEGMLHLEEILESEDLAPDLIITTGTYFISKPLRLWLSKLQGVNHIHLGTESSIPTPFKTSPAIGNLNPKEVYQLVISNPSQTEYFDQWNAVLRQYKVKWEDQDWNDFNEFALLKRMVNEIPDHAVIQVSNSMPVRYLAYLEKRHTIDYYSNRGTSGIDGCTSTAVGHAQLSTSPVYLITGDIAFFYDNNALWREELPSNLKIVLLNNSGGGIFNMIEGPQQFSDSLNLQTTPHNRTAQWLAKDYGVAYFSCDNPEDFDSIARQFVNHSEVSLFEIKTDMERNQSFYKKFKSIRLR